MVREWRGHTYYKILSLSINTIEETVFRLIGMQQKDYTKLYADSRFKNAPLINWYDHVEFMSKTTQCIAT